MSSVDDREKAYDCAVDIAIRYNPIFDELPDAQQRHLCLSKWACLSVDEAHDLFTELTCSNEHVIDLMQQFRANEATKAFAQALANSEIESSIFSIQDDMNAATTAWNELRSMDAEQSRVAS